MRIEEYYPNATVDTYKGVSGYIYSVANIDSYKNQEDVPYAVITDCAVSVTSCEYIPDAYEAIIDAIENGKIILKKYHDNNEKMLKWIEDAIKSDYKKASDHPEYREFLKAKFDFILK